MSEEYRMEMGICSIYNTYKCQMDIPCDKGLGQLNSGTENERLCDYYAVIDKTGENKK